MNIKDENPKNYAIQTTLNSSYTFDFSTIDDSIKNEIRKYAKDELNPKAFIHLDTNKIIDRFSSSYIILDRKTSKIVGYKDNSEGNNNFQSLYDFYSFRKFYGFLITYQKGADVNDEFQAFSPFNGKEFGIETSDSGKRTLIDLFWLMSGGEIPKYPHHKIKYNEWQKFSKSLNLNFEIYDNYTQNYGYPVLSSFQDYFFTFATVMDGKSNEFPLINSIKDQQFEVYKNESFVSRNLDTSTCRKMRNTLEWESKERPLINEKLNLDYDNKPFLFFSAHSPMGPLRYAWVICKTKNHLVGVLIRIPTDFVWSNQITRFYSLNRTQERQILVPYIQKMKHLIDQDV